ncbi:hypothetical protein [Burkholderia sp. SIMBA_062]|uniref:hypothetical protein n=1 Tax=Burkholderia sp. SIMBA_062 TaxID=3085803 RepID=UPI00397AF240
MHADQHERLVAYRSEAALYARHPSYRYDARRVQLSADSDCFGGTAYSLVEEIHVLRNGQPVLIKSNSAGFDEIGPPDQVLSPCRLDVGGRLDGNSAQHSGAEKHALAGTFLPANVTDLPPDASVARRHPERPHRY